jgi:prevent-host-death family protein
MESVSIEQARVTLGDLVDQARLAGTPTTIMRYRKPAAVIVPLSWYERAVEAIDADGPVASTEAGDRA